MIIQLFPCACPVAVLIFVADLMPPFLVSKGNQLKSGY
jgi:hypothetical protein